MSKFCCPHCGNEQLQVVNEVNVQTSGKNYSSAQGCLGYMLMGPLGLLCGSCGQGQKTTTTNQTYWVCPKCGNKFRDLKELKAEGEKLKTGAIIVAVLGVIVTVISLFGIKDAEGFGFFLGCGAMTLVIAGTLYVMSNKKLKEVEENEKKMSCYGHNTNTSVNVTTNTSEPVNNNTKFCPQCGERISRNTKFCTACGSSVGSNEVKDGTNEWKCPKCGRVNQNYVGTCGCGEQKPR